MPRVVSYLLCRVLQPSDAGELRGSIRIQRWEFRRCRQVGASPSGVVRPEIFQPVPDSLGLRRIPPRSRRQIVRAEDAARMASLRATACAQRSSRPHIRAAASPTVRPTVSTPLPRSISASALPSAFAARAPSLGVVNQIAALVKWRRPRRSRQTRAGPAAASPAPATPTHTARAFGKLPRTAPAA